MWNIAAIIWDWSREHRALPINIYGIVFLPFGSLMRWPTEFTASTAHPSVFFDLALITHSPASNGTDP